MKNKKKIWIAREIALAFAIGFIIFGCVRKEPQVVLSKATNICLQCIGVG